MKNIPLCQNISIQHFQLFFLLLNSLVEIINHSSWPIWQESTFICFTVQLFIANIKGLLAKINRVQVQLNIRYNKAIKLPSQVNDIWMDALPSAHLRVSLRSHGVTVDRFTPTSNLPHIQTILRLSDVFKAIKF